MNSFVSLWRSCSLELYHDEELKNAITVVVNCSGAVDELKSMSGFSDSAVSSALIEEQVATAIESVKASLMVLGSAIERSRARMRTTEDFLQMFKDAYGQEYEEGFLP